MKTIQMLMKRRYNPSDKDSLDGGLGLTYIFQSIFEIFLEHCTTQTTSSCTERGPVVKLGKLVFAGFFQLNLPVFIFEIKGITII